MLQLYISKVVYEPTVLNCVAGVQSRGRAK